MDFSFHLQQGQLLLEKQDALSIKRALEHFKEANKMTDGKHVAKPKILYHLALGNLMIGNIEQSYKIVHKAKRSIDTAIENSIILTNNMRQMLGEGDIDTLINHIEENYREFILFTDIENNDFDENDLNFSIASKVYPTREKQNIIPQISIDSLNDEVIMAIFFALSRTNDSLVYFDKLEGDVLNHVEGYFSSCIGDLSISNKQLFNRIMNGEPKDLVDEDRYLLISRLRLTDFLKEYKKQTKGTEPFSSFVDYFSVEVLKDFIYDNDLTIDDLANNNEMHEKFHDLFSHKYQNRFHELTNDYTNIFKNTCKSLAMNWLKENI